MQPVCGKFRARGGESLIGRTESTHLHHAECLLLVQFMVNLSEVSRKNTLES